MTAAGLALRRRRTPHHLTPEARWIGREVLGRQLGGTDLPSGRRGRKIKEGVPKRFRARHKTQAARRLLWSEDRTLVKAELGGDRRDATLPGAESEQGGCGAGGMTSQPETAFLQSAKLLRKRRSPLLLNGPTSQDAAVGPAAWDPCPA